MTQPSATQSPAHRLAAAIREAKTSRGVALIAYLTAGYPTLHAFPELLRAVAAEADVVEVGVPFSDPMADGVTIQDASRQALANGVTLEWILSTLETLASSADPPRAPIVLMSYLNPVLRFGMQPLARRAAAAGVSGVILPDLPFDEAHAIAAPLRDAGLAIVQMATPVTSDERLRQVMNASSGFLYAVTTTGTTGRGQLDAGGVTDYLDRLRAVARASNPEAPLPVCAGFGIRSAAQVRTLTPHADGIIVGSALIEAIASGEDAAGFVRNLRDVTA
jgi:tryptophan synthase alpha chain